MKILALFASIAFLAITAVSCQKVACSDPEPAPPPAGSCLMIFPPCDSVVCTMDFRSVDVRIVSPDSSAAPLDSFYVTDSQGVKLPPVNGVPVYGPLANNGPGPADGRHTVVSDLWVAYNQQTQRTVYAKGWRGGVLVVNEAFSVQADCCHVSKISGPAVIIVQ